MKTQDNAKQIVGFEQVVERGCGIDIHKKILVATIRGTGIKEETRSYDSFTESIEDMRDWLLSNENGKREREEVVMPLGRR